jgi:hypothetical protein
MNAQQSNDTEVFWLSLDEAKRAISDSIAEKYEVLVDRYERRTTHKTKNTSRRVAA